MQHAMDCKLILALVAFVAMGCGKSPGEGANGINQSSGAAAAEVGGESALPVADPTSPVSGIALEGPATWSGLSPGKAWTAATLRVVAANLPSLERAADKEIYCPGYSHASLAQRETCWVRLVSAVVQFESQFNPLNKYRESNGVYSVGLLQLSTGECVNAPTLRALEDPVKNLQCGTEKMAALIARDGYVTSPDNVHGAAAYWSTLRRPYVSGKLHLGKALEVEKITKRFLGVAAVEAVGTSEIALAQ